MSSKKLLFGLIAAVPVAALLTPFLALLLLRLWGSLLHAGSSDRRHAICAHVEEERKAAREQRRKSQDLGDDDWEKVENTASAPNGGVPKDTEWEGIVGFFHPFCNAGGGGERVLWAAIAATQRQWPNAICAVYTGDHEIDKSAIVAKVEERFDIVLREETVTFIYLTTRQFVLPSSWPYFTLLGQSLGSLVLAWDAFHLLVPDIFIDTMGYAFAVAFCKLLFPSVPTAAYVHYPTISTDMLASLDDQTGTRGIHSGLGGGRRGQVKRYYWHFFARLYGWVGRHIDVVMCNSTWTYNHIMEDLIHSIALTPQTSAARSRDNIILYIAQFRPEKNHSLILRAFSRYVHHLSHNSDPARLVMIGSVRANTPDEKHIYALRIEARELGINERTTFITDAPFSTIQEFLGKASIGVNGMYAEHFGIGNVEGLAAGLIPVVHRSGGPYLDIVVPFQGGEVGFHAETEQEYAEAFEKVAGMDGDAILAMRTRGRASSRRFGEGVFRDGWVKNMQELVRLQRKINPGKKS
ncbi:GDP-Man:Man(3)GlcNAc(2)-PP-Dol alpha-1,2-mannosyltransferase [Cyphellophora attinorum]|uniref:GDP-Man:Man(3)GlcNAc(2)-PP-Dol alpha-1,2-mannosyltransferase n=1 Tax=Cyphellophora attinorum TaxID=1664694 RepID=A0A0N1H8C4_9EURO|nr:GDP-Man:Man(3)GlcNAc(2)-PP-Dol alpha-1,2-mannosyltransferase [Phialophora attinorum]KPI43084.1 GDP-Man:Man(3)GlcNAc(2)-PP-Dol alpha-1,2-mannosyltransferase [Phialophora attinorum]